MRRFIMGLLVALLLLPGFCLPAEASDQTGSIQVTLKSGESPVVGGTVTLFRVGERIEGGYRITDAFGGGAVRDADALSPHLAQWLAQMEGEPGMVRVLDADGTANFSRLPEGLYLLVQNGSVEDFYPIMPFLMILPYEGQWDVQAHPFTQQVNTGFRQESDSPKTGQHPGPYIGALGMVGSGVGLALCAGKKRRK